VLDCILQTTLTFLPFALYSHAAHVSAEHTTKMHINIYMYRQNSYVFSCSFTLRCPDCCGWGGNTKMNKVCVWRCWKTKQVS